MRIGVAICDPDGILASPLPYIKSGDPKRLKAVSALLDEYQPISIFLGLPKHLSGEDGEAVAKVRAFAQELKSITQLSIIEVDERLSTVTAAQKLRESGLDARKSRELIDSMAACAILEAGLAHEN